MSRSAVSVTAQPLDVREIRRFLGQVQKHSDAFQVNIWTIM